MADYFVVKCFPPLGKAHFDLSADDEIVDKRWHEGIMFVSNDRRQGFHPPQASIDIDTKPERNDARFVYPEYTPHPIPLMSRRLVDALRAGGVDNLQAYETRLHKIAGKSPVAVDHYLAVNIVGCIEAADNTRSESNPEVDDALVSVDFFSLVIDTAKARGALMFRLADNGSAVMVHEQVKARVESAGITTLSWLGPGEWAG